MTDIRNPHNAADEETGNIVKKSAVAELCGTNAELMRNKVLAENSATFSMNSLVVFLPNCWDSPTPTAQPDFPKWLGHVFGTNSEQMRNQIYEKGRLSPIHRFS